MKRMTDLPQAVRLHRLHQRLEHIPPLPRSRLKIPQPMPIMGLLVLRLHHVTMLGLAVRR